MRKLSAVLVGTLISVVPLMPAWLFFRNLLKPGSAAALLVASPRVAGSRYSFSA
jgi:hypothetical protein